MKWLNVYKHLLPNARAWWLTPSKTIRDLFFGLTGLPTDIQEFADRAYSDIDPQQTRELELWENQFGDTAGSLTEQERRDRLDGHWKATGGQGLDYLQDTLQALGFNVYLHNWWEQFLQPLLHLPLVKDLSVPFGTGAMTFTRASTATYISPVTGLIVPAAIDAARFETQGLLMENGVENKALSSEDLTAASWVANGNLIVTGNAAIAPDGTLTAEELDFTVDPAALTDSLEQAGIGGGNQLNTFSIFIKPNPSIFPLLRLTDPTQADTVEARFNLTGAGSVEALIATGVGSDEAAHIEALANGWYRCSVTGDVNAGSNLEVHLVSNGGGAPENFYAWGAQIEVRGFPSSYIPTAGATVTREDDKLTMPTAGNFPAWGSATPEPMTVTCEVDVLGLEGNQAIWGFNTIAVASLNVLYAPFSGGLTYFRSLSAIPIIDGPRVDRQTYRVAITLEPDETVTGYQDGVQGVQQIMELFSAGSEPGLLYLGARGSGGVGVDRLNGHIRDFRVYDRVLTPAQVADLPRPLAPPTDAPIARNPFEVLDDGAGGAAFTMQDNAVTSMDGHADSVDGAATSPTGYALVNNIPGDNEIPADTTKYPYFLYIGGEFFPAHAEVPAARRTEFETACLKICPAQQWLGILVTYV